MLANSTAAAALPAPRTTSRSCCVSSRILRSIPARLPPLVAAVGLFYLVHLTVIFYILLVARQLAARERFSPAWNYERQRKEGLLS